MLTEAADGGRTRDLKLGKLALYQLSYRRAGRILRALGSMRRRHTLAGESQSLPLHNAAARVGPDGRVRGLYTGIDARAGGCTRWATA
jgi:hypothetical protein